MKIQPWNDPAMQANLVRLGIGPLGLGEPNSPVRAVDTVLKLQTPKQMAAVPWGSTSAHTCDVIANIPERHLLEPKPERKDTAL